MKKLNGKNYNQIMAMLWDASELLSEDLAETLAHSVMSPEETSALLKAADSAAILTVMLRKKISDLYGDETYVEEEE